MSTKTFAMPDGREIPLEDILDITLPKRDLRLYLKNIFKKDNPCWYFTILLKDGSETERIYSDQMCPRFKTLIFLLEQLDDEKKKSRAKLPDEPPEEKVPSPRR